jgi:hypothetical protein
MTLVAWFEARSQGCTELVSGSASLPLISLEYWIVLPEWRLQTYENLVLMVL